MPRQSQSFGSGPAAAMKSAYLSESYSAAIAFQLPMKSALLDMKSATIRTMTPPMAGISMIFWMIA